MTTRHEQKSGFQVFLWRAGGSQGCRIKQLKVSGNTA
jgi:hypothetical protein